jgi:outer membrane immunogenic protein
MKKFAFAAASALGLFAGTALASDLPSIKGPPAPQPVFTWTGFYGGVNLGGGWTQNHHLSGAEFFNDPGTGALQSAFWNYSSPNAIGFLGGGQIGYNYQFNNFVVGVETDFQGAAMTGASRGVGASIFGVTPFLWTRQTIDWFGTVRGRIGYAFSPSLLLYGTGGFAYGQGSSNLEFVNSDGFFARDGLTTNALTGWTAGGGVEWAFAPAWSLKLEYLYVHLGRNRPFWQGVYTPDGSLSGALGDTAFAISQVGASNRFHTIKFGLNYHFGAAGAAASDEAAAPTVEILSGTTATTRRALDHYTEGTAAVAGNLDESGVRSRIDYYFGRYDYPIRGQDFDAPWSEFGVPWVREVGKISGRYYGASFLVGYQFVSDQWSLLGMLGADLQRHGLSQRDPENRVQGTAAGFKVLAELDANPTDKTMLYAYGFYSTAFQTSHVDVRPGYLVLDNLNIGNLISIGKVYAGPQGVFESDTHTQIWKAGVHFTISEVGPFSTTIAAGYAHDRFNGPGAYGLIETSVRF